MTKPSVSKCQRFQVILNRLAAAPALHTSLEAYKLLEVVINTVEDEFLGEDSYNPPRSLIVGFEKIERMYLTKLESMHPVPRYTGVSILLSHQHVTFISRYGAIEIQRKLREDKRGETIPFEARTELVIFQKLDAYGDPVWHPKNL